MVDINAKIRELLQKEADPREGEGGKRDFARLRYLMTCPPVAGVVTDNRDPECLGRVRISYAHGAAGSVSPWLPVIGQGKGKGRGLWSLPEIGTQALAVFTATDRSEGYILGFVYDRQHRPPEHGAERASDTTLLQTKSHRIEITDGGGSEEIRIESAEGKMRIAIGKTGGIKVENELGGINIKCRSLRAESDGEIRIAAKKTFSSKTDGSLKINAKGGAAITGDKEATLKGKNIRLSGTKGVSAEGKQIAVQGDKVMGFDTHIMVVPSGSGTTTVPLPHPFIGKLKDELSKDVKIKDKNAATKDSVAKHDDSMHLQLPGTIKFQNNPKKEGKVTGGTSSKVKINGKETAVIGSQVTTCNDVGAQNNSAIIAPGASIPMPVIVNPLSTEEWKREREKQEKKNPMLTGVRWASTSIKEGEEAELSASVQDIADGNMVTLQVFREGQSPESGIPLTRFPLTVRDGSVSAKWLYRADRSEMPPEQNPKFIFTAHCAWCSFEKSSNTLEVKLVRPEITKAEWRDRDGNAVSRGLVGEPLKLHAETKDMEGGVTFRVYDDKGMQVFETGANIVDGKAEAEWIYHWNGEVLKAKPKFIFEVTGQRCKMVKSGEIELGDTLEITVNIADREILKDYDFTLTCNSNESEETISFDNENKFSNKELIPGKFILKIKEGDNE
ncbi:MAG: hypothetical protein IJ530_12700 [Treponema sp.]|uniref:phage baseplate assembly protein V n=1 Tax=Treponema sp. TaxID=166 RepID=UPI0025F84097|nr:phage baseplate assembly protein V [Treponema sp.]MBQ8680600.1 hypothetical protein [Treponema sp.]